MGIFLEYLKVSLWMVPVILLALWLLPKLSRRYTPKLAYFVWLLLAVRLLLPWNLTLPAETAPIHLDLPQETMVQWVPVAFSGNGADAAIKEDTTPVAFAETEKTPAEESVSTITPMLAAFALWLAGAAGSLLRTAAATLQMQRFLKRWEKEPSAETAAFYTEIAGEKRPPLAICPALETPMAVGLFHTKIYLPHEEYSPQEMEMIFRHELIHWRRRDLWYKFVLLLARSIHWFNPLVWFLAKRANRDLEISCDGEAVQGKDGAYRKAYSLMILQEAERSLQKQAALTTCFTDGKKALQERLAEILNREKRKKGMALVAMTLVLALTCGCFVSYGGTGESALDAMAENAALTAEQQEITRLWAEALSLRDGEIRYDKMGQEAKAQFEEEQKAVQGEDWDFNIGWSSPWVMSYEVEEKEDAAIITYLMQDSTPQQYTMKELLKFGEENGKTVVESYLTSNLYWEDGKVHPVIGRRGMELDEGIWDFLYQSVVGFVSQSDWNTYEMEAYNFNIINVEKKRLSNGRDEVIVDFGLQIVHRNHFCDPAETSYLKKVKEQGRKDYEVLYQEYYKQQESNTVMRFTCEVLPGEARIYEDTCYPETFRLYNDDFDPHKITFENKNPAYEGFYEEEPRDGWFTQISPAKGDGNVTVFRQIRISDVTGRTNNGYFDLYLEQGGVFEVAENAVITMGEAGEEPYTMTQEEWIKWLKEGTNRQGGNFTLGFGKDENGNDIITEARQGYWQIISAKDPTQNSVIPSGYPTDSKTVSAPFSMTDPKIKHLGMDFSSNGKNIPVSATADGIVMVAEFAPDKGYYVKINHMNGFTTLYAHLSELDVKVGDKVEKGHVLGLTGATGMATGIHCHYEIQLNGIYQDPAKYL